MEKEKFDPQNELNVLVELYKVADENHRFYVANRFTIISLYFPLVTLVLSGIYVLAGSSDSAGPYFRTFICILGFVLTFFLYSLESRNWILSNICAHKSKEIGIKIDGDDNLHLKLTQSYRTALPEGSTFIDKLVRKIARTQHKAVFGLTIILSLFWIGLAISSTL